MKCKLQTGKHFTLVFGFSDQTRGYSIWSETPLVLMPLLYIDMTARVLGLLSSWLLGGNTPTLKMQDVSSKPSL